MVGGVAALMGAWIAGSVVAFSGAGYPIGGLYKLSQPYLLHALLTEVNGWACASNDLWLAGPRIGRFDANGKPRPMPGHNNTFYVTGVSFDWALQALLLSHVSRSCSSAPHHSSQCLHLLRSLIMADLIFIFLQVLLLWFGFYDEFLIPFQNAKLIWAVHSSLLL